MVAAHMALGQWGEDLAATWYVERGYVVLDRNWRSPIGEIDLVVARREVLAICEVKTRRSGAFGSAAHAVTLVKQRRLRRLAAAWLATNPPGRRSGYRRGRRTVRFDVVAITAGHVDVFENAF